MTTSPHARPRRPTPVVIGQRHEPGGRAAEGGELVAMVAHELRNPLVAARLLSTALERGWPAPGPPPSSLRWIQHALHHALQIVERFEAANRAEPVPPPRRQWVDLGQLTAEVLEVARVTADAGARLALRLAGRAPLGHWDPCQIEQVVRNLVLNALKFGDGKPVRLEVTGTARGVRLRVVDRGIGIDPSAHARIFERFQRAVPTHSYPGIGLGLWLAREIVVAHGGHIRVDSRLGKGAAFEVWLPRTAVDAEGATVAAPGGSLVSGRRV